MPGEDRREEQVDGDVQAKPRIEAAVGEVPPPDLKSHAVHGVANDLSLGRGRLEAKKAERVARREQHEQRRSDPIEQRRPGHENSSSSHRAASIVTWSVESGKVSPRQ